MATVATEMPPMSSPSKLHEDESLVLTVDDDADSSDASDCSESEHYSDSDDDSEYSSDDYDSDEDKAHAALEQELRMNLAHQAQQRAGGVYVSSVLGNLLKKNASDSQLRHLPELDLPLQAQQIMRRGSANDAIGSERTNGEARLAMCIQTSLPTQSFYDKSKADHPMGNVNPLETLKEIRKSLGRDSEPVSNETVRDFFQHTERHILAYDMTVMTAVRSNDLPAMKALHASGRELQCCNRFFESILHTVARRGLVDMLDFLLVDAKLDLRVCCASGRTPLHDACWTASPNFACIKRILHKCPDFLLIADNRNFTPLSYIPRDCWGEWNDFLQANPDLVAGCWFM